ncbi:hypothetical protein NC653_020251 [Populus alba x Populus x berolinensis]|uniref:Uncharacterized protein n=1 Tax=Populus alba x Populus x berolinensis TaxID=444605 RepID=A0AAD6QC83_9ROSI|nr:hypothetical protein NC653_020251 [Populus alba x Populus x berolinensis]
MGADQFPAPPPPSILRTVLARVWDLAFASLQMLLAWLWFFLGKQFYRHVKTKGSPLASIARLVAAAIRRRRVVETVQSQQNYYNGCGNPIEAVG